MLQYKVVAVWAIALLLMWGGSSESLDCRKFVFAPACRGATVKRSMHVEPKKFFNEYPNEDSNEQLDYDTDLTAEQSREGDVDDSRLVLLKKSFFPIEGGQRMLPLLFMKANVPSLGIENRYNQV